MRSLLLCAAALGAAGCWHSVDVFVPAAQVSPQNDVVAAITPGNVQEFDPAAHVRRDGAIVADGRVRGHVKPTDTVVVAASAGDKVGPFRVERSDAAQVVMASGALLLVGGTAAAWIAGAVCAGSAGDSGPFSGIAAVGCIGSAFLGSLAAFVIGLPITLAGLYGPLTVKGGVTLAIDAGGIRGSF